MADHFEVTPEGLHTLAGQLRSVGETVSSTRRGLDRLGPSETGDDDLAKAVSHFSEEWKYSLKKIGETAAAVGGQLDGGATAYAANDQAIADALAGRE
jgi:hypothetical protein